MKPLTVVFSWVVAACCALLVCGSALGMANPASEYCVAHGGRLEIRTNPDGGQIGVCVFEDGSSCEEWAFYRGTCAPGQESVGISVVGQWDSSEGLMTLEQTGTLISGEYANDNGKITGTLCGDVLTGFWAEDRSGRKCGEEKHGTYYWGRIIFTFTRDSFTGSWGYCEDDPSREWKGTRVF